MDDEIVPHELKGSPYLFQSLFCQKEPNNLKILALEGHLFSIKNRFLSWRVFLDLLPSSGTAETWLARAQELRSSYSSLVQSHTVNSKQKLNLDHLDPLIFNPLSSASENPWNHFHIDNNLKSVIKLDIDRTYQDKALFLKEEVKELMTNVLFIWAKENPQLAYKQGMNDLLGVLVYVAYCDLPEDFSGVSKENEEMLKVLLNKADLEADLFWCFDKIMDRGVRDLFSPVLTKSKISLNKKNDLFQWDNERNKNDLVGVDKSQEANVSPILRRSHFIHHNLLKTLERGLYDYMEKQKIEPQMYLQRWLRCMLTREFGMHDCLIIWDALLASSSDEAGIPLLDYMCVSMLKFVSSFILQSDHFSILRRLFKFPPVEDVFILISMALKMMTPSEYHSSEAILKQIEAPEETYNKDILSTIKSAVEFIDDLITDKSYDEYKFQQAVDMIYSIKCQVIKEFPIEYEELN